MIGNTRTIVLTAATVVATYVATAADSFAHEALHDPWPGSNVACIGRKAADNKTYIYWTLGNRPFHACQSRQIGDESALFDDYTVRGNDGNDYLRIGCSITCGDTDIRLEADLAWGSRYIDLAGGDGNDRLQSVISSGGVTLNSWFFGEAGNDWLTSINPMGRMIAHGGKDTLELTTPFGANEWLDGGDNDDCLRMTGSGFPAYYDCGPGNDQSQGWVPGAANCETFFGTCGPPPP
jgi:hypothetical protein